MTQTNLQDYNIAEECTSKYKKGGFRNQCERLLLMFKRNRFIPTSQLMHCFSQYNARIYQLRRGELDGIRYKIYAKKQEGILGFELQ